MAVIVGLSGYARAGKDSVARVLVDEFGYQRRAFADVLREWVYRLNPIINPDGLRLKDAVDVLGWEKAKNADEVRRLLQVTGTECGRQLIGPDVWVDAATRDLLPNVHAEGGMLLHIPPQEWIKDPRIVFTDVRFPNEAKRIEDYGTLLRLERPSVPKVNEHISESALDDWRFYADHLVVNDGTLEDLEAQARTWGERLTNADETANGQRSA